MMLRFNKIGQYYFNLCPRKEIELIWLVVLMNSLNENFQFNRDIFIFAMTIIIIRFGYKGITEIYVPSQIE